MQMHIPFLPKMMLSQGCLILRKSKFNLLSPVHSYDVKKFEVVNHNVGHRLTRNKVDSNKIIINGMYDK